MAQADVLVYLIDVATTDLQDDLAMLQELAREDLKIIICLTKIDEVEQAEQKAEAIAKTLQSEIPAHELLKISAKEQVELLRRLYHDQLPFSTANMAIVRKIIIQSDENDVVFSGKTGAGSVEGVYSVGWFVGVLEKDNRRYYFATNLEAVDGASGVKARAISTDILKSLNIL